MKLDFWNNPLVVSAFRVKYRRGIPFMSTGAYVVLLAAAGAVTEIFKDSLSGHWPQIYFLGIMAVQFVLSGLLASSATSTSMRAEVTNGTLDLQRIAALSPRQILLGKLLGEPAMAYLLAIATIPLGLLCWTLGGVSLDVLVLAYVNLASNTLLLACLGLVTNLELTSSKEGGSRGTQGFGVVVFLFVLAPFYIVPSLVTLAPRLLAIPWAGSLAGLVTPVPAFYAILRDDPWQYPVTLFGVQLPAAWLTPLGQLALAYLCFQTMVRQLVHPLDPAFSKPMAYIVLFIVDLLSAAVLHEPAALALPLASRVAAFCLTHFVVSLGLMLTITPWRDALDSWVWRFRGRRSRIVEAWLGERSENGLALLTFCGKGAVMLLLLVLLPSWWMVEQAEFMTATAVALAALLTLFVLTLALGSLHQWMVFLAGSGGAGILLVTMGFFFVVPLLVDYYFDMPWVGRLSPVVHFAAWLQGVTPSLVPLASFLAMYGGLTILVRVSLHRRLNHLAGTVDQKLKHMGVDQPAR